MPLPERGLSLCKRTGNAGLNTTRVCLSIAHSMPRGTIYDRNGLPLATSNWDEIANHRDAYAKAGIPIGDHPDPGETRFYPLGPKAFHLLGDLRTRANWSARNSSLAERDSMVTLQGFDDRATVVEVAGPHNETANLQAPFGLP